MSKSAATTYPTTPDSVVPWLVSALAKTETSPERKSVERALDILQKLEIRDENVLTARLSLACYLEDTAPIAHVTWTVEDVATVVALALAYDKANMLSESDAETLEKLAPAISSVLRRPRSPQPKATVTCSCGHTATTRGVAGTRGEIVAHSETHGVLFPRRSATSVRLSADVVALLDGTGPDRFTIDLLSGGDYLTVAR